MGPKDRRPGKATGQASIPGAPLADNLYRLGVQSHQAGQVSTAEDYFSQAAAVDPRHVPSLYGLGLIALQTGRNALAVSMIEKAIALHGGVADWHYNLGIAYQNDGRAGEAMTHFERAAQLDPSNIAARVYIGNYYAAAGELDRAEEIYRSIIGASPYQLDVRENLARILLTRGRAVEAAAILQGAFRSGETPGMKSIFVQCAGQLGAAGRDEQFRHLVLRALTETWAVQPTLPKSAQA